LGGLRFEANLGRKLARPHKAGDGGTHLSPWLQGNVNRRTTVQARLGKKTRPDLKKKARSKKGWSITQAVECLPANLKP
jgi:hypothetical protein